ncbi:hypothetical protein KZX46_18255 [Polymorphobacter sp. PAMC 29334]|uniref:hypothetical protein n=1 Tax=Polymorphobacter sp. PAMC 29334 TaxID=2862331 RepID=UPI001C74AC3C|nr:hypothetical protein [Polymorphobacter sp. PAMC 29334]QYE34674.1 hypothetical protein KZX46_18255 [Polymorphobacter sp. PAMC 29334]
MIARGVTAALAAGMLLGTFLGVWLAGGSHLISVYTSPDRKEQLELYTPRRWQRPWFDQGIIPAFARLTSLTEDRIVAESRVFEYGGGIGGQIFWEKDVVQVSTVAIYRRATGKWEVER